LIFCCCCCCCCWAPLFTKLGEGAEVSDRWIDGSIDQGSMKCWSGRIQLILASS
jgi:hypothetical protein